MPQLLTSKTFHFSPSRLRNQPKGVSTKSLLLQPGVGAAKLYAHAHQLQGVALLQKIGSDKIRTQKKVRMADHQVNVSDPSASKSNELEDAASASAPKIRRMAKTGTGSAASTHIHVHPCCSRDHGRYGPPVVSQSQLGTTEAF